MITLRHFTADDAAAYQAGTDTSMTQEDILAMFAAWERQEHNGRYFEMFAIDRDGELAGSVSLYHHSQNVVSCGPDVFATCRRQGVGKQALQLAMELARQKGYRLISQQIRTDNAASIALHRSLGFETDDYVYQNRHGKDVCLYLKFL